MNIETVSIKVSKKNSLLRAILMALLMSPIMSTPMTSLSIYMQCEGNSGCIQETFFIAWSGSFLASLVIGLPIALLVSPLVARIADKI